MGKIKAQIGELSKRTQLIRTWSGGIFQGTASPTHRPAPFPGSCGMSAKVVFLVE